MFQPLFLFRKRKLISARYATFTLYVFKKVNIFWVEQRLSLAKKIERRKQLCSLQNTFNVLNTYWWICGVIMKWRPLIITNLKCISEFIYRFAEIRIVFIDNPSFPLATFRRNAILLIWRFHFNKQLRFSRQTIFLMG